MDCLSIFLWGGRGVNGKNPNEFVILAIHDQRLSFVPSDHWLIV